MGNVHMEATQINYRGGSKKMSVEEAIKAAGTEITPEEKTWIDSIPALTSSNAGKTDQDVIAPEFDAEAGVYAVGDKVMYDGKLYEFTTAHETPGDWDSSEVSETTVADELNSLESGLTNKVGIATATDLNNEKSIGARTFAYNTPNNPSNHSGSMLGLFQSESYGMQLAQSSSETEAYIRFFNNDTWSSWDKIVTDSDLTVSSGTITAEEGVTITNYTLQKSLKTVYLYMLVKFTPTLGTSKLLCVLPSGYRAQSRLLFAGKNGTSGKFVSCETDSYGAVRIFPTSDDSSAVSTDYFLTITFFAS